MTTELYALDYHDTQQEGTTVSPSRQDERQRVSETEYWEKYYNAPDVTYEWNNGYLEEKAVSQLITNSTYQLNLGLEPFGWFVFAHPTTKWFYGSL